MDACQDLHPLAALTHVPDAPAAQIEGTSNFFLLSSPYDQLLISPLHSLHAVMTQRQDYFESVSLLVVCKMADGAVLKGVPALSHCSIQGEIWVNTT